MITILIVIKNIIDVKLRSKRTRRIDSSVEMHANSVIVLDLFVEKTLH